MTPSGGERDGELAERDFAKLLEKCRRGNVGVDTVGPEQATDSVRLRLVRAQECLAMVSRVRAEDAGAANSEPGTPAPNSPLSDEEAKVLELIATEIRLRTSAGAPVNIAEYTSQFPEYEEALQQILQSDPFPLPMVEQGPADDSLAHSAANAAVLNPGPPAGADAALPFLCEEYEVLSEIGRGGMGVVYRARQKSLNRIVAVKVLRQHFAECPTARARFVREAQAAAAVRHDHVVTIYAIEATWEIPFLVMEFVPSVSLATYLRERGPPPVEEVLRIGRELALGLSEAHNHGIVHRDIKPSNILLEHPNNSVKISDFGLARVLDQQELTQSGTIPGTPQYMAPEQALGQALDCRADLFSLGSVLYALCTGRAPFQSASTPATLLQVCHQSPPDIAQLNPLVPDWLCDVIRRLHEKRPDDRIQSASRVAELLASVTQAPLDAAGSCSTRTTRKRATLAGIAIVALLLVLLAVLRTRSGNRAAESPTTIPPGAVPIGASSTAPSFPIVLVGRKLAFTALSDCVAAAEDGDIIELRSDGPFVTPPIAIRDTALVIRAGENCRPAIRLDDQGVRTAMPLIVTHAPLVLEGLQLERVGVGESAEQDHVMVRATGTSLFLANCRFVHRVEGDHRGRFSVWSLKSPVTMATNCEFLGSQWQVAVKWDPTRESTAHIRNSVIVSKAMEISYFHIPDRRALLELSNNTLLAPHSLLITVFQMPPETSARDAPRPLMIRADQNVLGSPFVLWLREIAQPNTAAEDRAATILDFRGDRNLYTVPEGQGFVRHAFGESGESTKRDAIRSLDEWRSTWKSSDTESQVGSVTFRGGDVAHRVAANPHTVAPEDFRLEFAGDRRKTGGQTVGAEVAFVGPGQAYHHWRQTPEYADWLKRTNQKRHK